jgi:hypothetical protein
MRWAIVLLLFWGVAYSLTIPLFESPDEPAHFARAYGISEGQFILKDSPRHLVLFFYEELKKQHRHEIISMMDQLLVEFPGRVRFIAPNTAMYSPVPYLFHALIVKSVTLFGESNFLLTFSVYLCRLTSLFLFLSILYLSSKIAPFIFWPVFWIATTPMALSQSAMVNLDFIILGACVILLAASFGDLMFSSFVGWASISACVLLLTKPPYAPFLLIPAVSAVMLKRVSRPQATGVILGVFLIPLFAAAAWNGMMVSQGLMNDFSALLWKYGALHIDPLAQLAYIKAYPLKFIQIIWNTLCNNGVMYLHQFVGILGWQDIPVPFWIVVLWVVLAPLAIGITDQTDLTFQTRFVLLSICIMVSVLILIFVFASAYMIWMPVGADSVNVQGRYFHPVAAVCFVGITLIISSGGNQKHYSWRRPVLLGAASLIHSISIITLFQKYA